MRKSICFILLVVFIATPAFAHNMMIIPQPEPGKVKVLFEDGAVPRHAQVVVYNEDGVVIKEGGIADDGSFSYPEEAYKLVADDGFGHRDEWIVGTEVRQLPKIPVVGGVLALFGGIAWFFDKRVKAK